MELNEIINTRLKEPIHKVWDIIGLDVLAIEGNNPPNHVAIEYCIDADRLPILVNETNAMRIIRDLIYIYGYEKVLNLLDENIKLV